MVKTTVYHFLKYSVAHGEKLVSPRSAVMETIVKLQGEPILTTAQEVDAMDVDSDGFLKK